MSKTDKKGEIKTREFKVNNFITLKLEDGETVIYVAGERVRQCKAVSLDIPIDDITALEDIKSIDEFIDKMNVVGAEPSYILTPEEEFWGHSSSLSVWAENDYNTNLLHSNLAFSLLIELEKVGDPIAKKILKKEIIRKMSSGFFPTIWSLVNANYPYYYFTLYDYEITFTAMKEKLSEEQLKQIIELEEEISGGGGYLGNYERLEVKYSHDPHDLEVIKEIEHHLGRFLPYREDTCLKGPYLHSEEDNNEIWLLALDNIGLTYVPECVSKLKNLTNLRLGNNKLKEIPDSIGDLENLSILGLYGNLLTSLPESISKLENLDALLLSDNKFTEFPSVISSLENLKSLRYRKNHIYQLPSSIKKLKNLETLDLNNNSLREIPSSIFSLQNLKELLLDNNLISHIPKEITNLQKLKHIYLNNNQLKEIPQFLTRLKSLEMLRIENNPIEKFPDELKKIIN